MMDEDEEFELWFQQALASGLFLETPRRRKTWSPFSLQVASEKWLKTLAKIISDDFEMWIYYF